MTIVVTDNCRGCRFTKCVNVCPVSCFHGNGEMLYIDNQVCIDCSAYIKMCPVEAIYAVDDMPEDKKPWIKTNAKKARWLPIIEEPQDRLLTTEGRREELGF